MDMALHAPLPAPLTSNARVVGDRVDDGAGCLGTVRYVGPVATSKDASTLYYGIEWDAWGRGKHDGSVLLPNGERVVYFSGPPGRSPASTNNGELSFKCSFVKIATFDKSTERSSLLQRLQERYATGHGDGQEIPPAAGGADVIVAGEVGTTLGSEKPIEFVGAKKLSTQQTLQTIEKISLSGCQITELGSVTGGGGLKTLAPNLTELDLSRNLFRSWGEIRAVLRELPMLETLILSGNRFQMRGEDEAHENHDVFPNVKVLVLNQTLLSWTQACELVTRHFPRLEELHLADNEYDDNQLTVVDASAVAGDASNWLETLTVLDLSLNYLSSWPRVLETVGIMFTSLQQLFVNGNRIATLVTGATGPVTAFQQLKALSLTENRVGSWTSIDALNAFPQLDTLRLSKNPLTAQMSLGEARMLVVARTDHVSVFNASPVHAKERKEAEQLYLKRILHELAVIGPGKDERDRVLAAHPRFPRLHELYPEISIDGGGSGGGNGSNGGPRKLASSLIKVTIVPMSMLATSFEPLMKKIPEQMKISQLKLLVEAKFGVEVPTQVLSFRADPKSLPMLLDDDSAEIGYFGLQNGAEVLVNDNE